MNVQGLWPIFQISDLTALCSDWNCAVECSRSQPAVKKSAERTASDLKKGDLSPAAASKAFSRPAITAM